eukprot:9467733-Pyramimonas_sp.AAC.1
MSVAVRAQLLVKSCSGQGGVNNKFLLAPRKYLDPVAQGPLEIATQTAELPPEPAPPQKRARAEAP